MSKVVTFTDHRTRSTCCDAHVVGRREDGVETYKCARCKGATDERGREDTTLNLKVEERKGSWLT